MLLNREWGVQESILAISHLNRVHKSMFVDLEILTWRRPSLEHEDGELRNRIQTQ